MESLSWVKTVDEVLVFPEIFSRPTRIEFDFIESEICIFVKTIDELQEFDWSNVLFDQIVRTLEINHLIVNVIKYKNGDYSFIFPGVRLFYNASSVVNVVNQFRNEYKI